MTPSPDSTAPEACPCDGCIYQGRVYDHLNHFRGIPVWRECKYKLPFFDTPEAAPQIAGRKCNARAARARELDSPLPCPFCGSTTSPSVETLEEAYGHEGRDEQFTVVCSVHENGCGASCGFNGQTVEGAISLWNTRATRQESGEDSKRIQMIRDAEWITSPNDGVLSKGSWRLHLRKPSGGQTTVYGSDLIELLDKAISTINT